MKRLHLLAILLIAACGHKSTGGTTPPGDDTTGDDVAPAPDAGVAAVAAPDADMGPTPEQVHADLLASETSAYESAKPVFDKFCGSCHSDGGKKKSAKKLAHFNVTTYPFGGEHVATMSTEIRHVLGVDGAKPTMPADKKGAVKGDDLALITAWADAWDAADQGGAHEGLPEYAAPADAD
jgi:hypothetical protein